MHVVAYTVVIIGTHEAIQWAHGASSDHFEVASFA